jgi:hypothetical protein
MRIEFLLALNIEAGTNQPSASPKWIEYQTIALLPQ